MMQRRFENQAPQLSFTSDFHELLEGDLRPGAPLTIRYDPDRLAPLQGYIFGDDRWQIMAHLRFVDQGPVTDLQLRGPLTALPDRDPMGQGAMLTASTVIPREARFLEVWVSGEMPDGTHWDSDYGYNYWFRFPYLDLYIVSAEVVPHDRGDARFTLSVTSVPEVDAVRVRYSDITTRVRVKREENLREGLRTAEGRRRWEFDDGVALTALIRFKLYYWTGGRRYKDDNSGQYYTADRPDLREEVPPPPKALVGAAHDWQTKLKSSST